MSQPFYEQKLALLKQRQEQLLEEYAAVQAQMGRALGEVEIVRLRRQAEHTEQVLLRNEQEQAEVSRLLGNAAASPPAVVMVMSTTQRANLADLIARHFNEEEVKDICFRLGIEYSDLPAVGRAGKIRELVLGVERQGRVEALQKLIRELRPRLNENNELVNAVGE